MITKNALTQLRVIVDIGHESYVSLQPSGVRAYVQPDLSTNQNTQQHHQNPQEQQSAQQGQQISQEQQQPNQQQSPHVWVALDAVDGTLKLCGLGNEPGSARVVNDGTWAIGERMCVHTHTIIYIDREV